MNTHNATPCQSRKILPELTPESHDSEPVIKANDHAHTAWIARMPDEIDDAR